MPMPWRTGRWTADEESVIEEIESPGAARTDREQDQAGHRGWSPPTGAPTTLVLVRHGVTKHTSAKKFSGGLGGDNPPLSEEGLAQARALAPAGTTFTWIPRAENADADALANRAMDGGAGPRGPRRLAGLAGRTAAGR